MKQLFSFQSLRNILAKLVTVETNINFLWTTVINWRLLPVNSDTECFRLSLSGRNFHVAIARHWSHACYSLIKSPSWTTGFVHRPLFAIKLNYSYIEIAVHHHHQQQYFKWYTLCYEAQFSSFCLSQKIYKRCLRYVSHEGKDAWKCAFMEKWSVFVFLMSFPLQ